MNNVVERLKLTISFKKPIKPNTHQHVELVKLLCSARAILIPESRAALVAGTKRIKELTSPDKRVRGEAVITGIEFWYGGVRELLEMFAKSLDARRSLYDTGSFDIEMSVWNGVELLESWGAKAKE